MTKITKKYIFERKLDGKPIIIYVDEGFDGWATNEDARLLQTFGIIAPYGGPRSRYSSICTHDIITYSLPFDPHDRPVTVTRKGDTLGPPRK